MQQTTTVVTTPARSPIVRHAGEGTVLAIPPGDQIVSVSRTETGGALEIVTGALKPGLGTPIHRHRAFDEVLYMIEGSLTFLLGDEKVEVAAGGSVLIPAGLVHAYKNASSGVVKFLQITAPGGMEGFFAEFAARPSMSFEELIAMADEQGTDILAPPF